MFQHCSSIYVNRSSDLQVLTHMHLKMSESVRYIILSSTSSLAFLQISTFCLCIMDTSTSIMVFVATSELRTLICENWLSDNTLMELAGPPCREVLETHQLVNLLHAYIKPVTRDGDVHAVQLRNLCGKVVLLYSSSGNTCVGTHTCIDRLFPAL